MALSSTPPAEQTKRGTSGEPPTVTPAKPGTAKFGASLTVRSFAAVVSSSTAASARLPLHTMSFLPSISSAQQHQDHQQKQEHAQSSANPASSTYIPSTTTSAIDAGYDAQAHVRSASGSFSDSSKYHSPLANSSSSANTSHDSSGKHSTADSGNTGASIASYGWRDVEHDNDFEGGESSDVEIYLDTLGLHESAAPMHVLVSTGKFSISLLYPLFEHMHIALHAWVFPLIFSFSLLSLYFLPFYSLVGETGRMPVGFHPLSLRTACLAIFRVYFSLFSHLSLVLAVFTRRYSWIHAYFIVSPR